MTGVSDVKYLTKLLTLLHLKKAKTMTDETVQPVVLTPAGPVFAEAPAPAMPLPVAAAPVAPIAPTPVVRTGVLKSLLIAMGHDVEADWDHLVALASKV